MYIYICIYVCIYVCIYIGSILLQARIRINLIFLLPRAFRDPSESSASVNCVASDKLPRTFRAKRPYAHKKSICFREASENLPSKAGSWTVKKRTRAYATLPRTFRVKRPPSSRPLPGCHCVANTILAYGTLTRTLRTASAQIPRIFPMFSDRGDDRDDDDEGNLPTAFRQPSANLPSQARMLTAHIKMLPRSFRKPSEQSGSSKTIQKNSLRRPSANLPSQALLWKKRKELC